VTGHSQGGGISDHIATKYDLEGHHYNPAINHSNIVQAGKFANNKNAQSIYKTHLDFASPLAYSKNLKKSNTTVHTVGTIKGTDSPVSTHSIDQSSPIPSMVHARHSFCETPNRETINKKWNQTHGRVPSRRQSCGLRHGPSPFPRTRRIIDAGASASKMTTHIGVDVAINEEHAVVDEMIVDTSLALAPETMGLSIIAGAGAVFVHHIARSWVDKHVDKVADKAIDTVAKAGHKATNVFFSLFKDKMCVNCKNVFHQRSRFR